MPLSITIAGLSIVGALRASAPPPRALRRAVTCVHPTFENAYWYLFVPVTRHSDWPVRVSAAMKRPGCAAAVLFLAAAEAAQWVYEVHVALDSGEVARVQPVRWVPAGSGLAGGVCGAGLRRGDLIPAEVQWSTSGDTSAAAPSCVSVSGAVGVYGQRAMGGGPGGAGELQQAGAATLAVVADAAGASHLVWMLDRAGNSGGGSASAVVDAPDLAGSAAKLQVVDTGNGTARYDAATGIGAFSWKWSQCCAAGAVLGPLPPGPACVQMRYKTVAGAPGGTAALVVCRSRARRDRSRGAARRVAACPLGAAELH